MKFIGSFVVLLFVFVACSTSDRTAPTSVQFNLFNPPASHLYETVFNVGNEMIVHHWEYLRGEWKENIAISSSALKARKFPVSDPIILASGFPDAYEIKAGRWNQVEPPHVPTVVPKRYKQYLQTARDLSDGNWPGVLPR